jgi:Domain of unknown function (DUF4123)
MAMSVAQAAPSNALSLAQQHESLWANTQHQVYAVFSPNSVPGLRERLAQADVSDWDGLWTGELDAEERAAAPLLVTLKRESDFTQWLLADAAKSFGAWGAIAKSKLPFLAMRTMGRALCKAQLPNGQAIRIDWMDPDVLEALLPVAPPEQLHRVFADIDALITLAADRWTQWSVQSNRLHRQITGLA